MADDPNLAWWEERAPLHLDTPLYRQHLDALGGGGLTLHRFEREGVGDVAGLRLLHLQCHIGTDTLSWSRLGADVTGIDFSAAALEVAAALSERFALPARFVRARVDAPDLPVEDGAFDLVFTSYGTVTWFRDLAPWAGNIARALKPGGRFFFADAHPFALALDDEVGPGEALRFRYGSFARAAPHVLVSPGSYADRDAATVNDRTEEWNHPISEMVRALLEAGLALASLDEHDACPYPVIATCEAGDDGLYRLPSPQRDQVPLLLTMCWTRPGDSGA